MIYAILNLKILLILNRIYHISRGRRWLYSVSRTGGQYGSQELGLCLFFELEGLNFGGGHAFVYHVFIQLVKEFVLNIFVELSVRSELVLQFCFLNLGRSVFVLRGFCVSNLKFLRDIAGALATDYKFLAQSRSA